MIKQNIVYVVYDVQCPFCRNYCKLVRLRKTVGSIELIDARKPSLIMNEINAARLDIDKGMVVKIGDDMFYGADAIHKLALLSTRSDIFNRCAYWIFKSKIMTAVLYPFLRGCRNVALRLMGIPMIKNLDSTCSKP